jgi:cytochrome c
MFIKFVNLPQAVISNSVYTFTFLTLFSIFLICGLTYAIYRSNKVAIAALVFPLVILVIFFNIFNQQQILAKSYQDQIKQTNNDAAILEKEKLSKVVVTSNVNAEEIYNTKCSSCHKFDQKLVGPAHKDVIPKYNGDVSKLSSFIQNPVKIDPAYPPMPSLGITKKEADALANYLIGKVVSK